MTRAQSAITLKRPSTPVWCDKAYLAEPISTSPSYNLTADSIAAPSSRDLTGFVAQLIVFIVGRIERSEIRQTALQMSDFASLYPTYRLLLRWFSEPCNNAGLTAGSINLIKDITPNLRSHNDDESHIATVIWALNNQFTNRLFHQNRRWMEQYIQHLFQTLAREAQYYQPSHPATPLKMITDGEPILDTPPQPTQNQPLQSYPVTTKTEEEQPSSPTVERLYQLYKTLEQMQILHCLSSTIAAGTFFAEFTQADHLLRADDAFMREIASEPFIIFCGAVEFLILIHTVSQMITEPDYKEQIPSALASLSNTMGACMSMPIHPVISMTLGNFMINLTESHFVFAAFLFESIENIIALTDEHKSNIEKNHAAISLSLNSTCLIGAGIGMIGMTGTALAIFTLLAATLASLGKTALTIYTFCNNHSAPEKKQSEHPSQLTCTMSI